MVLEHAPVTGLLLGISALSTTITPRHYMTLQRAYVLPGWKATIKRLPLGVLPFGSIGVSFTDVVCAVVLLFEMRTLERRWGSAQFLAFVMTAALAGSVLLNILITESTPPLSLEQLRVLSAGGSIVPFAAFVTCKLMEVPSLHHWRIPVTSIVLTEKMLVLVPLLRLVLFPDTEVRARTHKQHAVHVDIGLWTRVMLALFGVILSIASKKSRVFSWWLRFVSRTICSSFLNFMQPVLSALFGPPSVVELTIPPQSPGRHTATDGRYAIDNLAGPQEEGNIHLHRVYSSENAALRGGSLRRRRDTPSDHRSTDAFGGAGAVTDERVAQIMDLGLGFEPEAIRSALIAANGHVDVAVEYLVNRD
ncbi:hypothetical protein DQ04_00201080 [Trypanosoma grayi]|uniref:hypothetical protein n=1 Tax=Trypanosoma grayi TaxID=71804 RepID=UPI0004F4A3EB|nr:hypothetical protein DQ04_00201080 [Trypanosoma grayi]KEG15055.1 hypothetical protein DQ04_00201080 [Trypanosoma grayi]